MVVYAALLMNQDGTTATQGLQRPKRVTTYLDLEEWDKLKTMSREAHRKPGEQLRYLIAREAKRLDREKAA